MNRRWNLAVDRKYQSSRPSTCQALLLLAIREFGMGEYYDSFYLFYSVDGFLKVLWTKAGCIVVSLDKLFFFVSADGMHTGMAMRMVRGILTCRLPPR